ncbi:hypothetical protein HK413_14220 [Mucilaginibacter sp. S1162]|uniref:Uncharacterized protein n=1 Tax=Mucilaginibacter humi TaxID=2732510 RepID=A0ABX1W5I0_9SPHI|nr:DUF5686 family protein [Mucilaginibacter humi]NNU34911.1 hypothetical protein [Mucilaginibacter humi]
MPVSTQYDYSGNVFGFKFGGYYIGVYNNYKFNVERPKGFFNGEILRIDTAANSKDAGYWFKNRPIPLTALETRDFQKKDSIERVQKTKPYLDSLQKPRINYHRYLTWWLDILPPAATIKIRYITTRSIKPYFITRLKALA